MPRSDSTNQTEWIVASLRWLTLMGITIALAAQNRLTMPLILVLAGVALWNTFLTIMVGLNRRFAAQRYVNVGGDMVAAYLIFFLTGGVAGGLGWAGLLPILSASLYFQVRGALLVSLINLLAQGLIALDTSPVMPVLFFLGIMLIVYLVPGLALSYFSQRMINFLNYVQKGQTSARREAEKVDRERRSAIYNLISALSSSLNYQRVLETALDLSATALTTSDSPADRLVSSVLLFLPKDGGGTELHVGSARRFTPADMRIRLPAAVGLIARTVDDGESRLSKEVNKDPELGRVVALRSCKAAYCIPLRTGLDTYGVLLFAHPEAEFFTIEQREVLDIVGNQATIAIQNARLYQDLELEKERMMEIQEEARKKMARDLHDGPTQSVAAIAMRVNFARRLMERDAKAAGDELVKIEDLARRTTKEIRHMLFTLRPLVLESQGLVAALESMAEKMKETYSQDVIIQADPRAIAELEMGKQGVIFYIAEEAVNNARKHAKAPSIWVRLKLLQDDLALLEIEDNGVGFNVSAVDASYENRGSLGMVNMRERAELVNGILHIDSAEGRGTRVQVAIPLTEDASDRIRRGL